MSTLTFSERDICMSKFEQIMRLSGYSRATVSRVINNSPNVNPDTREKILQIMNQLDYAPNRNAVALSKGRTQQIGIVIEHLHETTISFLNHFIQAAVGYGFQTIIYTSQGDKAKELQAFEDLRSKRVDGLLIMTCVNDPGKLSAYCRYGPIISWQRMRAGQIPSVAMDQGEGYRLGLEHLLAKGFTRIANAFGRPNSLNTKSRRLAFEAVMKQRGLPVRRDWYRYEVYGMLDGEQAWRSLAAMKEAPEAVLCANDYAAAGILNEARRQHLAIPGELAIIGFDDTDLSASLGITTIHNPIKEQAQNAFYWIWNIIGDEPLEPLSLSYRLVERQTS
ncbi:transcriptional regulator [Paenibacillus macerans]|uniref:Periplasmic binding s and sugar binding domain of LacI family protein n=2 Tax=Paenibacillus macerans TaxID=44252 RepID=A0A090YUV8_PAEMA|nr:periplasmic binding s and sugar binding domain of LacI family protein [Paenibacillus macerans]SUA84038.1 transcriptional regulator [Paenibacillus macerans]